MKQTHDDKLLDFVAEGFLQRNASITFTALSGIPALQVSEEGSVPRIYVTVVEEVLKMSFLKQLTSEEIFVPVLKSEEEKSLKAILAKAGITTIKVYRLSTPKRNAWYYREFIKQKF